MHRTKKADFRYSEHRYQSIIIFLNRRCNVGCESCNVAAHPGDQEELSPQWISSFFHKLKGLSFPGYILWTGGEPFFSFESLLSGISLASNLGYHSEILSSGVWYWDTPECLDRLASYPNFSLRISLDEEHFKTVSVSQIIRLIRRAFKLKVEVNFTWRDIPGQKARIGNFIKAIEIQLPDYFRLNRNRSRWIHYIPHIPVRSNRDSSVIFKKTSHSQKYKKACKMIFRDLVIGPDGLVYPCCGFFGFPFHKKLAVGNVLEESWQMLVEKGFQRPLFKNLLKKGPFGICRNLNVSPENWNWPFFSIPCDLCMALFNRESERIFRQLP